MKALTIKNPWATLICAGIKDVENRSWKTDFRGRILVHTSQKSAGQMADLLNKKQGDFMLTNHYDFMVSDKPLVNSALIGEVDIVDCIQDSDSVWAIPGQWHWILKNPAMYEKPVLNIKGALSFWNYNWRYDGRMENKNATR